MISCRTALNEAVISVGNAIVWAAMDELVEPILNYLKDEDPGEVAGAYLYGSGATAGLRPDSDIDLLILTRRSLTIPERSSLVSVLLSVSGWKGHVSEFPEVADRRPLEVTNLVIGDLQPLTETPRCDFQFGEWMREELLDGHVPSSAFDPDVVILLATALSSHRVLYGPALESFVDPVPPALLQRAQLAVVPDLVKDLAGDERNVLLTLARILVTIETGHIVSKDCAAQRVAPRLTGHDRALLELAREDYLGISRVHWNSRSNHAAVLARTLAGLIREAADPSGSG